ncbi:MAG: 50S ribosomal protein L35ae [Nanoarchaeota archaeon]|nr:50S ribosomal protein L35ae [Nanoarchaeota archaeon]
MKGILVQFRRGRHTIHERHYLIDLGCIGRDEAKKMVGKTVEWKSSAGKIISGKISDAHGNKGLVRAIFESGLPGQAVAQDIEIKDGGAKAEKKVEAKK